MALVHTAFYKFVTVDDPSALARQLRAAASELVGVVIIAGEGVSGAVAGALADIESLERSLRNDARLCDLSFKRSNCTTPPYAQLRVRVKPELVALGLPNMPTTHSREGELNAGEWRDLLSADDVVVIDNRNGFEYRLGHFKGAVNPQVENFRDLPGYLEAHLPKWQAQGKRLAMYCTGGIRCEKTAAWLDTRGVKTLQLDGGLLQYFAQDANAHEVFEGACFVFDNRLALDTHLNETPVSPEEIYAAETDGAFRIERAKRLRAAVEPASE